MYCRKMRTQAALSLNVGRMTDVLAAGSFGVPRKRSISMFIMCTYDRFGFISYYKMIHKKIIAAINVVTLEIFFFWGKKNNH